MLDSPPAPGGVRVLVIEDEQRLGDLLYLELSRIGGHSVTVVRDGQAGLEHAAEGGWDMVVLDLMLPTIDGIEVCRRIRRDAFPESGTPGDPAAADARSHVPIIMLTARDEVHARVGGLDAGADDYVTKPFHVEELLARMRAVLRRRHGGDHRLRVADLRLDRRARTAERAGSPLDLTRREFDLLAFLMENSPWVMTRDAILERVWGYAYAGTSNIVDVMVYQLREKVDRSPWPPLIKTVRGVGYVLRPQRP